ncbi:MAG: Unknown protein [uncultured Sulfurovum sp.]|uniref:Uncharacterized protein n=1 Tax=uncultured Sulfurovum sp. TaxID=269237 RepID=A0A6S6SEA4_9BACT|nr:MAG: Unknown protein [uncultured Sulfurovum sp.]
MKNFRLLIGLVLLSSMILKADAFVGIIKPIKDIRLSVDLDGTVDKLYVKEGSFVKKNQKLLKLKSHLQELELNKRKVIWKDQAQLNAARKNREIQKSLLDSTQELYDQTRAVSRDELSMLESKYHILNGEIRMREENEKKEKLEYRIAREMLSKYTVKSPIAGVVTELAVQKGEWAKTGKPFIRVVNANVCYIDINIDEAYSSTLKVGDNIDFTVEAKSVTANKKGKVTFISPIADMASGLIRIKIQFSNLKNRVTPGLSATINIDAFSKPEKKSLDASRE